MLWQVGINNCIFFPQFPLIVLIIPRPSPIGIRHNVLAFAREDMRQSAIADHVGLTRATVNQILQGNAATGVLEPGKSTGVSWRTTPRQNSALLKMIRQDRFISAPALTACMRYLFGMMAGHKTINNRLLSHGYYAYRPTRKPQMTANHCHLRLEVAQPDSGPLVTCNHLWRVQIQTLPGRWQAKGTLFDW